MTQFTFSGCKHLDFETPYDAKRQQTKHGLFWMRKQEPKMVQFCRLRGRIYGCLTCLSKERAMCSKYEEIEHAIEVSQKELESQS